LTIAWHPYGAAGALAALIAFAVDHAFGEPQARWHPVVWMGRALSACGAPWPGRAPRAAFLRGSMLWLLLAAVSVSAALALERAILRLEGHGASGARIVLAGVLLGLALKPLLAWRMLHDEVAAVESALEHGVEAGRDRLRHIVSRDTAALTSTVVRESALESLAENLNDSWVAPLFWFALGGLPAAVLYRFANTADAMWGRRGPWEWAGKWAARADDALSYVPARLTALLLAIAAWRWPRGLAREAKRTASPNGGWPMATLALALDVRLSKPGCYELHAGGRIASPQDLAWGLAIAARAAWGALLIAALAQLA
jgi:adenosylcobinamide-phosphate synthase